MDEPRKLPPIRYAKLRGLYPQKVYAAIRNGLLPEVYCDCGRKAIEVKVADEFFKVGGVHEGQGEAEAELDDEPSQTVEEPPRS